MLAEGRSMAKRFIAVISVLVTLAAGVCGVPSRALAASTDVQSPAGTVTGMVVVFTPAFGAVPGAVSSGLPILPPLTWRFVPSLTAPGVPVAVPPGIILLTPTPATGSLVVPLRSSFTQLQLVIPGPNPAQNTTVSLAQLLNTLLESAKPAGSLGAPPLVSVFSIPATP
jgi:hypothetical protein